MSHTVNPVCTTRLDE